MSELVKWDEVYLIYKEELEGIYDSAKLDDVLSGFVVRFEHYATREHFHSDPTINAKVRGHYQVWADKCSNALKIDDGPAKMLVIDTLMHMTHKGGYFGIKLVKDFDVFKAKLKVLEDEQKGVENDSGKTD